MVPENDWRRTGQEKYLMGADLIFVKSYMPHSPDWQHEHCEFCMDKIGINKDDLHSGYCTIDRYHWICCGCYEDFKDEFKWNVIDDVFCGKE